MAKKKQLIAATVLDVLSVTVDEAGIEPALIALEVDGAANVQLRLGAEALAKLEAMLAKASVAQAKTQPIQ